MTWLLDAEVVTVADKAAADKEAKRQALKAEKDRKLSEMTHTLSDGSVLQVRPQDMLFLDIAIGIGTNRDWVTVDNNPRFTTITELQEAKQSAVQQAEAIYAEYIQALRAL